ncbi:MAG: hypothetical protein WCS03_08040 [Bacteroidota bacterium]
MIKYQGGKVSLDGQELSCHDESWQDGKVQVNRQDGVRAGKEACVLQRRDGCREGLQNSCLCVGSPGVVLT